MADDDFEVVPDSMRGRRSIGLKASTKALLEGKTIRTKRDPGYFNRTLASRGYRTRSTRDLETGLFILWAEKKEVN